MKGHWAAAAWWCRRSPPFCSVACRPKRCCLRLAIVTAPKMNRVWDLSCVKAWTPTARVYGTSRLQNRRLKDRSWLWTSDVSPRPCFCTDNPIFSLHLLLWLLWTQTKTRWKIQRSAKVLKSILYKLCLMHSTHSSQCLDARLRQAVVPFLNLQFKCSKVETSAIIASLRLTLSNHAVVQTLK